MIDLDLRAYFENVRHHILLGKLGERISPLLSNVYLNAVDGMLEKAKEVTREGERTRIEYARFAADLVVLVDGHPRHDRLHRQVFRRIREELARLEVEVNEEKSRTVDLVKGESFGYLGFDIKRVRSRTGRRWVPWTTPKVKKRTELLAALKVVFRSLRSQPVQRVIELINPKLRGWVNYFAHGNASRCFSYVRDWAEKKVRRHLARNSKRTGFALRLCCGRCVDGFVLRDSPDAA